MLSSISSCRISYAPISAILPPGCDYDGSTREYIPSDDEDTKEYNDIGSRYFSNGEIEKAREQFFKALDEDSTYAMTLFHIAGTYREQGMDDMALEYYEKALDANPSCYWAKNNIKVLEDKKENSSKRSYEYVYGYIFGAKGWKHEHEHGSCRWLSKFYC